MLFASCCCCIIFGYYVPLLKQKLIDLIDGGNAYESDDFTVMLQPFFSETEVPRKVRTWQWSKQRAHSIPNIGGPILIKEQSHPVIMK